MPTRPSSKIHVVALSDVDASAPTPLLELAAQTGLSLLPDGVCAQQYCDFLLHYSKGCLWLKSTAEDALGAICVDFDDDSLHYRQRRPVRPEALLKAGGIKRGQSARVVDATAGLGLDAFLFASAGAQVTMFERSPVLHALLLDGLRRGMHSPEQRVRESVARMHLQHGDSAQLMLQTLEDRPELIYLDPMFPERKKSAKVKKNMALLQQLLHAEPEAETLLHVALQIAGKRVLVKRPRHAPFLDGRKPSFSHEGKSSRFDVYLSAQHAS